jgi:hypothetical protein
MSMPEPNNATRTDLEKEAGRKALERRARLNFGQNTPPACASPVSE